MPNKLKYIKVGVGFTALMVMNVVQQRAQRFDTAAVQDKRAMIEERLEEIGADQTVVINGTIFAIDDGALIHIAEKDDRLRYDDSGMPVSERRAGSIGSERLLAVGASVGAGALLLGEGAKEIGEGQGRRSK